MYNHNNQIIINGCGDCPFFGWSSITCRLTEKPIIHFNSDKKNAHYCQNCPLSIWNKETYHGYYSAFYIGDKTFELKLHSCSEKFPKPEMHCNE